MINKKIIEVEMHFDNYQERENYQKLYEKNGYTILGYGSADDWYFRCERIINHPAPSIINWDFEKAVQDMER